MKLVTAEALTWILLGVIAAGFILAMISFRLDQKDATPGGPGAEGDLPRKTGYSKDGRR